jgi:hypothetical protein
MPHIVLGEPSQRNAHVGPGNLVTEDYLGVWIQDAPDEWSPGQSAEVTLVLMYWPEKKYEHVRAGATFTLREGPNVAGFGHVMSDKSQE